MDDVETAGVRSGSAWSIHCGVIRGRCGLVLRCHGGLVLTRRRGLVHQCRGGCGSVSCGSADRLVPDTLQARDCQ